MEKMFSRIVDKYVSSFIDEILVLDNPDRDTLFELWNKVSGMTIESKEETPAKHVRVSLAGAGNVCAGVFKSGAKKGLQCGKVLKNGEEFCKRHDKKTCNHTLPSGEKCKKVAGAGEFCSLHKKKHDNESVTCAGVIKNGSKCKKTVKNQGDFCSIHKKQTPANSPVEPLSPVHEEVLPEQEPEQPVEEEKMPALEKQNFPCAINPSLLNLRHALKKRPVDLVDRLMDEFNIQEEEDEEPHHEEYEEDDDAEVLSTSAAMDEEDLFNF